MRFQKTSIVSTSGLIVRTILSILILGVGVVTVLVVGEVKSEASLNLSHAPIHSMTTATDGQELYVTLADNSQQGIYRSDDNGQTWRLVSPGPGAVIEALAVHPTNKDALYAGTAGGPVATTNNLWRSYDGGQTWHKFILSLPGNVDGIIPDVTTLAVDPNRPDNLFVGTAGQGVYRFDVSPEGYGYRLVGDVSLRDARVQDIIVGPDSRLYALTNESLFVSIDDTWKKLDTLPEPAVSLAVDPADPDTLYAGAPSSGAYRSIDGGRIWESISDGLGLVPGAALRVTGLAVDEKDTEHIAAATAYGIGKHLAGGGIYESYDAGHSWTQLAELEKLVTDLTFNKGVIHAAAADGLVRYSNPTPFEELPLFSRLSSLAQLSGIQVLILTATVGLISLVLSDRTEWRGY